MESGKERPKLMMIDEVGITGFINKEEWIKYWNYYQQLTGVQWVNSEENSIDLEDKSNEE